MIEDIYRETLEDIEDIAYEYDFSNDTEQLKALVREIYVMARMGREGKDWKGKDNSEYLSKIQETRVMWGINAK